MSDDQPDTGGGAPDGPRGALRLTAQREALGKAVAWALRTVGQRERLPGLSGVLFEADGDRLTLRSTDLDLESELHTEAVVEQPGAALVPGRVLGDIVRTLPDAPVEMEQEGDDRLQLRCGRAQFSLRLLPLDEYQHLGMPEPGEQDATLPAAELARTVELVSRAAHSDYPMREAFTAVSLRSEDGELIAAATDTYRLAVRRIAWEHDLESELLVPRRAMQEAGRVADEVGGEVRLATDAEGRQLTLTFADRRLATRLVDDQRGFPDVDEVVPTEFATELEVDCDELVEVVRRVSAIGEKRTETIPVRLQAGGEELRVWATGEDIGSAEDALGVGLQGEELEIAFNPQLLLDGLEAIDTERVALRYAQATQPVVIEPVDSDETGTFRYLLMRMHVD